MKKQSAKTTATATIKASIEFDSIYQVISLENGLITLLKGENLKGEKLTSDERQQLERFIDLVSSLTGTGLLAYWLAKHN